MNECKKCRFRGIDVGDTDDMVWCNYLEGHINKRIKLNCKFFIPEKILCSCGKNAIWIFNLDQTNEKFTCDDCLDKTKFPYSVILIESIIAQRFLTIYRRVTKTNKDYLNMVKKHLTTKEQDTYSFIIELGGAVLVRSLSDVEKGCLGKLMKYKLGEMCSINQSNREFKVFKLYKGVYLDE